MKTVSELNKQKVRLFFDAVINDGRIDLIDELLADDYVGRLPWAELAVVGRAQLGQLVAAHRLVHPDVYVKIEDEIAEDDLVVMRWRATSTASPSDVSAPGGRHWSGISVIRLLAGVQVDSYTALAPTASDVVI